MKVPAENCSSHLDRMQKLAKCLGYMFINKLVIKFMHLITTNEALVVLIMCCFTERLLPSM